MPRTKDTRALTNRPIQIPAFRAANSAGGTAANTGAFAYPTGWVPGDLLLAAICLNGVTVLSAASYSPGWTLIRATAVNTSDRQFFTLYRVAGPGDSGTQQFDFGGSTQYAIAMAAYSGVRLTNPIDVESGQSNASSVNCTAPAITIPAGGAMGVFAGGAGNRTFTAPASAPTNWNERADVNGSTTVSATIDDLLLSPGTTGTITAVISGAITNGAHLCALIPRT